MMKIDVKVVMMMMMQNPQSHFKLILTDYKIQTWKLQAQVSFRALRLGVLKTLGQVKEWRKKSKAICTKIVGKLNGSDLANSFVSSLVCDLEDYADGQHCETKHKVLSIVPIDNPLRSALEKCLETFDNPFESFDTEAKRKTYFRDKWGIVDPVEKTLGIGYDTRLNKKNRHL